MSDSHPKATAQTVNGRRASEIFATEAMAGVPSDGAAGSITESLSKLACTLDPAEIKQKGRRRRDMRVRDGELSRAELFLRGTAPFLLSLWESQ